MEKRESIIRSWFDMWLHKEDTNIQDLFDESAVYIESWGPEYHGTEKSSIGSMNGILAEMFLNGILKSSFIKRIKRLSFGFLNVK